VAFLVEVPVEEPMIRINITAPKAALAFGFFMASFAGR
jgi:hypothetical protein